MRVVLEPESGGRGVEAKGLAWVRSEGLESGLGTFDEGGDGREGDARVGREVEGKVGMLLVKLPRPLELNVTAALVGPIDAVRRAAMLGTQVVVVTATAGTVIGRWISRTRLTQR